MEITKVTRGDKSLELTHDLLASQSPITFLLRVPQ